LFLVLLVVIWIIAALLLWSRHGRRAIRPEAEDPLHRKFVTLNNWLMILLTFVIFAGTLFPFFSGLLAKQKITLKSD
jgi:cytochrome c biogenesis factor